MDLKERVAGQRHPWEVVRAEFFLRLVRRHLPQSPQRVLDVGAGDGWLAERMGAELGCDVVCWDSNYTDADLAPTVGDRATRTRQRPAGTFPLAVALDVLEHIDDDAAFVAAELAEVVAPDGVLVVSVPAGPRLFTEHDRLLGHFRRHTAASLRALLTPSFTVIAEGSLFSSLVVPRAAQALAERHGLRRRPTEIHSQWTHGEPLTSIVTTALRVDAAAGQRLTGRWAMPGLSRWAVCRR